MSSALFVRIKGDKGRGIDRQTGRQTDRQKNRQTGRQTEKGRGRGRDRQDNRLTVRWTFGHWILSTGTAAKYN